MTPGGTTLLQAQQILATGDVWIPVNATWTLIGTSRSSRTSLSWRPTFRARRAASTSVPPWGRCSPPPAADVHQSLVRTHGRTASFQHAPELLALVAHVVFLTPRSADPKR